MFSEFLLYSISILLILYSAVLLYATIKWQSWMPYSSQEKKLDESISILIPVRNEEHTIKKLLDSIQAQTLAPSYFEVIVIDDHSEDSTRSILHSLINQYSYSLRILSAPPLKPGFSGKKNALTIGIESSSFNWIYCTDGDSTLSPSVLFSLKEAIDTDEFEFISAPIRYPLFSSLLQSLQAIESAALVAVGGIGIKLHRPQMCNGANLSFKKDSFFKLGGYSDHAHIPSGDDEFLLHSFHKSFPEKIGFLKNTDSIVTTSYASTWNQFLQQRIRWAGKWKFYQSMTPKVLAFFVWFFHFLLVLSPLSIICSNDGRWIFFISFIAKICSEVLFLSNITSFLGYRYCKVWILVIQIFYSIYVVWVGVISQFYTYQWKGRSGQ